MHPLSQSVRPFQNLCAPYPIFCSIPFQGILDSPPLSTQIPSAITQPTNLFGLDKYQKGEFTILVVAFYQKSFLIF